MKISHILAALTLLLATLAFHAEASATLSKKMYEGQVLEVNQDEEGSSIVIKTLSGTHSVYAPRSRANEEIIGRALKAHETKSPFKISTEL
ncbi:hypothetical protein CIK05_06275 [Bdellovibrio sp. qaytius]|nr:hypothetical protein CIK05_06275 [Bdellovibrio sp. qaytius]